MNRGKSEMKKQKKDAWKQKNVMDKKMKKAEEKKAGGKESRCFLQKDQFQTECGLSGSGNLYYHTWCCFI